MNTDIQAVIANILRYYDVKSNKVNEYVLANIIADEIKDYIKENNNE